MASLKTTSKNAWDWVRINLFVLAGILGASHVLNVYHDVGKGVKVDTPQAMWVSFFLGWWVTRWRK